MNISELIQLYKEAGRRFQIVGNMEDGVLMALDVEGRLFAYKSGVVLNRINPEAIAAITDMDAYINPGGDGFWPAPEGSAMGYEYAAGIWRVPPGLTNARWQVKEQSGNAFRATAEVDLINASGIGLPFLFARNVKLNKVKNSLIVAVTEEIEYLGSLEYSREQAVAAPWSLCQFDCGEGCKLFIPNAKEDAIWDLYPLDSACHRRHDGNSWEVDMVTDFRFQLGIAPSVDTLLFQNTKLGLEVERTAAPLAEGLDYINIADTPPDTPCTGRPCRFSAYCDPSGFMEIEAAGGTPETLKKGAKTALTVITKYTQI